MRPGVLARVRAADTSFLDAVAYIRECGLLPLTVAKTAVTGAVLTPFRARKSGVNQSSSIRKCPLNRRKNFSRTDRL